MYRRVIWRAAAAALLLCAVATASVLADSIVADADAVSVGDQPVIDLGTAAPGQDVAADIAFRLDCSGTSHVDAGQSVRLYPVARTIPPGGSYAVGGVTLAPPAGWPIDGETCPAGLQGVVGTRHVIVTAPADPGTDLRYVFSWTRSLVPASDGDTGVLDGANPTVTFILDVADNTPPVLDLPDDSTVEGDTTSGAIAAYTASASDAEDSVAPSTSCSPVVGALLPLGTTTVSCAATDSGGLTSTGSFHIAVVDTTAPTLDGLPADRSLTTSDLGGLALTYPLPAATDIVDPDPAVDCAPANGSQVPVGRTTVACKATDASGNSSTGSFVVDVVLADPVTWSAMWGRPIAPGETLAVHRWRTIPLKVEILGDGVAQSSGDAWLDVATCDGQVTLREQLEWHHGRWATHLRTGRLHPACYVVTASLDGHAAGSFRLDILGAPIPARRQ
jgi:hypothetical protein